MKLAPQISFHGMERSEAVEAAVRRKLQRLERLCPSIMACRVSVDLLQKHQQQGQPFGVRVDVTLPGHELVVNRVENEDVYVALRDAVDDMARQLEDAVRRMRGQVKQHPRELHGQIVRINDEGGFGFVRTPDGDEYYFGRDNLTDTRFEQLQVGAEVQFIAEAADQGPQARRVSLGKHRVG